MTEVAKPKTIEEALIEKVRQGLGDMVPEDVLKAMVDKALNKILFEERRIDNGYGRDQVFSSPFVEEVKKQTASAVTKRIEDVLKAKQDEIEKVALDYIKTEMPNIFARVVAQLLTGQGYHVQNAMTEFLSRMPR